MPPHPTASARRLLACFALALAANAKAEPLRAVLVRGVEGDERANVLASLSVRRLPQKDRADLSEGRLSYLLRVADDEVREALQPYGYYDASVESNVTRDARGITVTFNVAPGQPVRVNASDIRMDGPAQRDATIRNALRAFTPRVGERLDHRLYEASKLAVQRRLIERGYFDADLVEHRIEVRRAAREANMKLRWESGERYRFGELKIEGSQVRDQLLMQSVPFEEGEHYHQRDLLALHQRLTDLDYFGYIDVRPDPDNAQGDRVPVLVSVTPGKRSIYTAGLSYGTDSGAGVQLGLERRWVNDRGHKFGVQLDYAQRRKSLGALYRIPAFEWAEGWYAFGLNRREEENDSYETRINEFLVQRTGRIGDWMLGVGLHLRDEDFVLGKDPIVGRGSAQLVYPALSAERKEADDPLYPRAGWLLRGEFKLGANALGSETDFRAIAARCEVDPRPRQEQPPARARTTRPHLHGRIRRAAAVAALLRRRRSQHPRLRLSGSRPAPAGPGDRRQEPAHRQHRIRADVHAGMGCRGVRGCRRRLQLERFPRARRHRRGRALALSRGAGARRRRARHRRRRQRGAVPHQHRAGSVSARGRRIAKYALLGIAALLLLAVLFVAWLLRSGGGRDFALARVLAALPPDTLSWQRAEGTLAGPLVLHGVRYAKDGLIVEVQRVTLDIAPAALAARRVHVQALTLQNGRVQLPPGEDAPEPWPEQFALPDALPELALPVSIVVDTLHAENLRVEQASATLIDLHRIDAGGRIEQGRVALQRLEIDSDRGTLRAQGDLDSAERWRSGLQARVDLAGVGDAPLPLTLDLQGTLDDFTLDIAAALPETCNLEGRRDRRPAEPAHRIGASCAAHRSTTPRQRRRADGARSRYRRRLARGARHRPRAARRHAGADRALDVALSRGHVRAGAARAGLATRTRRGHRQRRSSACGARCWRSISHGRTCRRLRATARSSSSPPVPHDSTARSTTTRSRCKARCSANPKPRSSRCRVVARASRCASKR